MNTENPKILFVIDKIELKYFEFNDLVTNFSLIKEFLKQGSEVFITTIEKLSLFQAKAYTKCAKAHLKGENIYYEQKFEKQSVENFNLVMFRPDPPVDLDYINATFILDFVDREKTVIINETSSIRDFNEKMHANLFVDLMPENIVSSNKEEIIEFLNEQEEIILKPLNKCFGSGVMYLKKGDKNTNAILNTMTDNQKNLVMVQKYLSAAQFGDKRVLTLGDEILDECVVKLPSENDFKFNTHSDEYIKKSALTPEEKESFKKVAKKLNSLGIPMAGLDVVDGKIIEINVTSPCYFIREINNYFGTGLEKKIVGYILNFVNSKQILCK